MITEDAQKKKPKHAKIKCRVRKLTGISELEYNTLIFDRGIDYIDSNESLKKLAHMDVFWCWWIEEFHKLDEDFLETYKLTGIYDECDQEEVKKFYYKFHEPGAIDYSSKGIMFELFDNYGLE